MNKFAIPSFDKLFSMTADGIKAAKKPIILKKNQRALEASIDSAAVQKMDAEEKIQTEIAKVSDGETIDYNSVLEQMSIIESADETIRLLGELKTSLFGEVTE